MTQGLKMIETGARAHRIGDTIRQRSTLDKQIKPVNHYRDDAT